jgi:hypothetical protein
MKFVQNALHWNFISKWLASLSIPRHTGFLAWIMKQNTTISDYNSEISTRQDAMAMLPWRFCKIGDIRWRPMEGGDGDAAGTGNLLPSFSTNTLCERAFNYFARLRLPASASACRTFSAAIRYQLKLRATLKQDTFVNCAFKPRSWFPSLPGATRLLMKINLLSIYRR